MRSDPAFVRHDRSTETDPPRSGSYHGGTRREHGAARRAVESVTPTWLAARAKRIVRWLRRRKDRARHLQTGRFVELGRWFRFDRSPPYRARVGDRSIAEDFNVWNAGNGDIVVGSHCWFGLHNVVMGPVEIGDRVSTGPYVAILGPRHPTFRSRVERPQPTRIGDDVWISAGSIILSGAVIGHGAVIGAGSVVSGRVPPNSVHLEPRRTRILPRFS